MPFSPLPKTFLDDLQRSIGGRIVELGCGDGRFAELLIAAGAHPLLLDRTHPRRGSAARVVADALRPPLPLRSVDLLVAANTLRHVVTPRPGRPVPHAWPELVAPGGCLYILEDHPCRRPAAARNYRDLQTFLARVAPELRRPLLPRREFERACRPGMAGGDWTFGEERNLWPCPREPVVQLLSGAAAAPAAGEAARLLRAVNASGVDYGRYWWARWCRRS